VNKKLSVKTEPLVVGSSLVGKSPRAKKVPRVLAGAARIDGSPVVVRIGASVGGLKAFSKLLAALPLDTGMAFVLVQRLDSTHQSPLTELLGRHLQSRFEIREPEENLSCFQE
jgi:chemotaxis response regulator CheB